MKQILTDTINATLPSIQVNLTSINHIFTTHQLAVKNKSAIPMLKNENWNEKITNLQPTFFQQNQLKYTYANKTNFWGGNEYLNFDNKYIRNSSLNVVRVIRKDIFHHYVYNAALFYPIHVRYQPTSYYNEQFHLQYTLF